MIGIRDTESVQVSTALSTICVCVVCLCVCVVCVYVDSIMCVGVVCVCHVGGVSCGWSTDLGCTCVHLCIRICLFYVWGWLCDCVCTVSVTMGVVQEFQRKLSDSRRIVVVGNGGIAVELVYVTDHLPISIQ